jgi:hypothetical protein
MTLWDKFNYKTPKKIMTDHPPNVEYCVYKMFTLCFFINNNQNGLEL